MSTNISQNDLSVEAEKILKLSALKSSAKPDVKNVFKHEEKEKAFKKRYGKDVSIIVTYDHPDSELKSFDFLSEYTLRFETPKGGHYAVTEYLDHGATRDVILSYRKNGRNFENHFNRFVDAEVTLADLISEEE